MKLLIWTPIPTHHQSGFLSAVRSLGIDLVVHYYLAVPQARLDLGWSDPTGLPPGERRVPARIGSLKLCADWKERIHILPGCGRPFLFALALACSLHRLQWLHWSEPSSPYSHYRLISNLVRRRYAALNNRFGCGALAIGELARRDFIDWGIKADRIRFLPYSIDPVRAASASSRALGEGGVRFLYLGVFEPRKGLDILVAAFAQINAEYPNASLTLVGADHSQGKYHRQAESLGIQSIEFKTPVPAADIGEIIGSHDVLVLPSRFDGWGMVLSEGASMGRALISTAACGAAFHLIEDGVAGYRVPPGSVATLVNAMRNYCEQPQQIATHGRYSSKLFQELTPQMNARRLQSAITELCTPT